MAEAIKQTREVTREVIETKKQVVLTMSLEEALVVRALLGRCCDSGAGSVGGLSYGIYDVLDNALTPEVRFVSPVDIVERGPIGFCRRSLQVVQEAARNG